MFLDNIPRRPAGEQPARQHQLRRQLYSEGMLSIKNFLNTSRVILFTQFCQNFYEMQSRPWK